MNFIVHGAAGKEAGIPFGNLSIGHGGDGLHRLSLVIQFCTVGDGDMVPGLQFRELAHRSGIGALHAGFDVDNAAGHSLFSGLAHGPAHGNDAVTAVRGEDIPLGHLAAIAQGCGVSHAISHGSIVAESHVLAISCMGIHAQCDTGITGFRAIADSNRIVPGCRINADGYRVRSFGQCIDTGSQGIRSFSAVVIVVALCCIGGVDAVEMGLRILQLADIDGIRIIHAGPDVDDAAGQSLFSGLAHGPAHGNDAVTAVRGEDIPLCHLAAIAQGRGVLHAACHGSIVAKGHVLAIARSSMHTNSDTVVTGSCRIPYSDSIILCGCFKSDGGRIGPTGQGIHAGGQGILPFGAVVVIVPRRGVGGIDTVEMGLHLAEGISHSPAGDEPLVATLDLAGTNSTAPGFRIGGLFFICRIPQLHGAGLFILDITIGIFDRHLGEIRTDIGSVRRSSQRLQLFHNNRIMVILSIGNFNEAVIKGFIIGSGRINPACMIVTTIQVYCIIFKIIWAISIHVGLQF